MLTPTEIKREGDKDLKIKWSDKAEFHVGLELLRDECPCVNCQGETVMFSSYIPIKAPFKPAGFYEIENIEPVGNYAIQVNWKDGHNTGIYSWETLRKICEMSLLSVKNKENK